MPLMVYPEQEERLCSTLLTQVDPLPVRIVRGPNIGEIIKNERMPEELNATVAIKVADKITTDHIIPGGGRMKYRSNMREYSKYLFETIDPNCYERAKKIKEGCLSNIIVGGVSYGQGLFRGACGPLPNVHGRGGRHRLVLRTDPHRQSGQFWHTAPDFQERIGLRPGRQVGDTRYEEPDHEGRASEGEGRDSRRAYGSALTRRQKLIVLIRGALNLVTDNQDR